MNRQGVLRFFGKIGNLGKMFLIPVCVIILPQFVFSQRQERAISKISWRNEPIKIVKLKTKGKVIELGKKFSEKDDWLKGLTVTVENVSDKPISRIELDLSFPRPEGTSETIPTYIVKMIYGRDPSDIDATAHKQVLPGESVDVKLLEVNLPFIKKDLENQDYPETITHTQVMISSVTFNDGTMWNGGDILYPHPTDPKRKYDPKWTLPEKPKPTDQSSLTCNLLVPFFQNASFRHVTTSTLLNSSEIVLGKITRLQQLTVPCNTYFVEARHPECGTSGSGCTRLNNIFEDSIDLLGIRNARKELASERCVNNDGTFCNTLNYSNFRRLDCNQQIAGGCNGSPDYNQYPTTGCASGFVNSGGVCTRSSAFINHCNQYGGYDYESCNCVGGCEFSQSCSPVLIDVLGNGFALSDAAGGVNFDVDGDGIAERRAWTITGSDDAWLVRDKNANGTIDSGRELFGSATSQPPPPADIELNGFNALNEYDKAGFGGNDDGVIDNRDAIFSSLRLWQDINHNGISESNELHTLISKGLARIDTDYKKSRRVDQFGNEFRYRAKVRDSQGAQVGRWAWDVFLVTNP